MKLNQPPILTLILLLAMAVALASGTTGLAADPGFYLRAEPSEATVGTPIELSLQARDDAFSMDRIQEIRMQADKKIWHVDSDWRRDWQADADKKAGPWHARVRPFELGELAVPPVTVHYLDEAGKRIEQQVTTTTLKVISIRPAGSTDTNFVPLRDPAEVPRDFAWIWQALAIVLGCALLVLLIAWLVARHRRGPLAQHAAPQLPPGLWALEELDRRSRLPVCQSGPAKTIFSLVSEVIRIYLGRRYGIDAIDMTTLECLRALNGLPPSRRPAADALRWTREFLDECDMVKFTQFEPARERWSNIWNDARLIVKLTTPETELETNGTAGTDPRPAPLQSNGALSGRAGNREAAS